MDFKELIEDAAKEAREYEDLLGGVCTIKSFFKWSWKKPHEWKKWKEAGKQYIGKSQVGKIYERECKICGIVQNKTIKWGGQ